MNQLRYVLLVVTVIALVGVTALALDVPHAFVAGTTISADDMNANFTAVETAVSALEAQLVALQGTQPRVAHTKVDGQVNVNLEGMQDVVVVSIEAPAAGVVVVHFTAQAAFSGNAPLGNGMGFQIDTEPGGGLIGEAYFFVADALPANSSTTWRPVAAQRAFEVVAGTHTYRAEAGPFGTLDGERLMWNPSITATWYPTESVELSAGVGTSSGAGGNQP